MELTKYMPRDAENLKDWARRISRPIRGFFELLSLDNTKLLKSHKTGGFTTASLALAPAKTSGFNVCQFSTKECRKLCVNYAGNGRFNNVQQARIRRTRLFFEDRDLFAAMLRSDLRKFAALAKALGVEASVRLNTFSDIPWERIILGSDGTTAIDWCLEHTIQAYDYTKSKERALARIQGYDLTFSRSELTNDNTIAEVLAAGVNVAVPFAVGRTKPLPSSYLNHRVVDGDATDLRYRDPKGVIIGLRLKGRAIDTQSPFVIRTAA